MHDVVYVVPFKTDKKDDEGQIKDGKSYVNFVRVACKLDLVGLKDVAIKYCKKNKDIVENSVMDIVHIMGRYGSAKLRRTTTPHQHPRKDFCRNGAALLSCINMSDLFYFKLGYFYFSELRIIHEFFELFLQYWGPGQKDLTRGVAYAFLDKWVEDPYARTPKAKGDRDYKEMICLGQNSCVHPENLPLPLYSLVSKERRALKVTDYYELTLNNWNFGRTIEENNKCVSDLASRLLRVISKENNDKFEQKITAICGLKFLKNHSKSDIFAYKIYSKLTKVTNRREYLLYRSFVTNKAFAPYKDKIHKNVNPDLRQFVRAYEHPDDKWLFKRLNKREKLMLYPRLTKEEKELMYQECLNGFDGLVNRTYYDEELYYSFKILSEKNEFCDGCRKNEKLYFKSMSNREFRILYLLRMHAVDGKGLKGSLARSLTFVVGNIRTEIMWTISSGVLDPNKNKKYRCTINTYENDTLIGSEHMEQRQGSPTYSYSVSKTSDCHQDKRSSIGRKSSYVYAVMSKKNKQTSSQD